jgi:hypothetical protein
VKPVTVFTPKAAAARAVSASSRAAHALGLAVAPHVVGQDGPVALVDQVADGLADQVVADREALQAVGLEQLAPLPHIALRRQRLPDVEVVAPARELEAVVAHAPGQRRQLGQRQVGPLAGEEGDGSCHDVCGASRVQKGELGK